MFIFYPWKISLGSLTSFPRTIILVLSCLLNLISLPPFLILLLSRGKHQSKTFVPLGERGVTCDLLKVKDIGEKNTT